MVTRSRVFPVAGLAVAVVAIATVGVLAFARVEASRRERLTRTQGVTSGGFLRAGDVELHVVEEGPRTAPVVLFLHGTGAWSAIWSETVAKAAGALLGIPLVRETAVAATLTNPWFTKRLLLKLISDSSAATPERVAMLQRPHAVTGTTEAYGAWVVPFLTGREHSRSTESARYRSLMMPTLVIWGARDAVTPLAQGRRLAGLIPGAQLKVLPTAGHIPAIEAGPQFEAALVAFLLETIPLRTTPVV